MNTFTSPATIILLMRRLLKRRRKQFYLILAGLAIIAAGGAFAFSLWVKDTAIVQTLSGDQNSSGALPISGEKETPPRETLAHDVPDHLWIPDRNIDTPVIYVSETSEEVFQDALANGVVHYPGTAVPGEPGNPYIFGHSSDYQWKPGSYKKVFKPLVDIPLNTIIRITNHEGKLFIYKVIETKIVGPKETSVLDQGNNERTLLSLQTSWPVGTALKRFVAIAELDEQATYGPTTP